MQYGLPELKKYRIIFFSRFKLDFIIYYIDFEPKLLNLIHIATGIKYQPAVFSFKISNNGKKHEITLPSPHKDK